jgi:transcriptional regulator with XRE-family HTH domain
VETIHDHAKDVMLTLGSRIHAMRESRGWTLDDVAEQSGLSKAYLSRLESGDRQPSLAALVDLAKAFGVSIAAMFEQPDEPADCVIVRGQNAPAQIANGLSYIPLSGSTKPFNLHPIAVTIPADREGTEAYQHDGEEWLHVIEGKLSLSIDGKRHELCAGDSAHFDSRLPHRLDAMDGKEVKVLLVACPIPLAGKNLREMSGAMEMRFVG